MSGLRLENVCYRYKNASRNALDDINCSFEAGKLHAVMGSSGSGKTTLLSIIAGLDTPTRGSGFIDGDDIAKLDLDRYRRERVSIIFQAFQLFPLLTVLENASYPMEMNGKKKPEAEARAKELLESVGIGKEMHKRYPSNLSGGEQQRVAIARALSTGARVLLADEPTGNLDAANSEVVMDILRRLAQEGYCVIVVTHSPVVAESADIVFRMKDGVIGVEG